MESLINFLLNAEDLGVVTVLTIAVVLFLYTIRHLHKREQMCQDSRLEDANERAELREHIGELAGKVDTLERVHIQHLQYLQHLDLKGKDST